MKRKPTIGIAVLTYYSKKHLAKCLPPFLESPLKPRVIVIDSSSKDGTVEEAQALGVETIVIPQTIFNHGLTREMARKHLQTDIVVMVTPDAYALDNSVLEKLIRPLMEKRASASYARQLPHDGAGFFESFPRIFNYPTEGHVRSLEDVKKYGVYTFFCSDSCAAYVNSALDEIGGFKEVLLGEDTVAAAELLRRGHKIAYAADAQVKHSHRYSLKDEFQRYFDTGIARTQYRHLIQCGGKDSKRGNKFLFQMTKTLIRKRPDLLPYAFLQTFVKWCGYQVGKMSVNAPLWWKRKLSSQPYYWKEGGGSR